MATETQLIDGWASRGTILSELGVLFLPWSRCRERIGLGLAVAWLLALLLALGCPWSCRPAPVGASVSAPAGGDNLVSLQDLFNASPQALALPESLHCSLHNGLCQLVLPLFSITSLLLIIATLQNLLCPIRARLGFAPIPPPPRFAHAPLA